jgi:hypothetical protein
MAARRPLSIGLDSIPNNNSKQETLGVTDEEEIWEKLVDAVLPRGIFNIRKGSCTSRPRQ